MGGIQPCCFEERKNNRKNGIMRLTNKRKSNPIINSDIFKKFKSTLNYRFISPLKLINKFYNKTFEDILLYDLIIMSYIIIKKIFKYIN